MKQMRRKQYLPKGVIRKTKRVRRLDRQQVEARQKGIIQSYRKVGFNRYVHREIPRPEMTDEEWDKSLAELEATNRVLAKLETNNSGYWLLFWMVVGTILALIYRLS